MAERIDVMISSTARDLPEHRKQATDACLRQGMFPIIMETLPSSSSDAIDVSLNMVEEAEIYLGIFGHRYGYVPDSPKNPDRVSVTELEYRRAKERGIPLLLFMMDKQHPITADDMETDPDSLAKLLRLKKELETQFVVSFFSSPQELRAKVIDTLSKTDLRQQRRDITNLHSVPALDIPEAPAPYIAHPYTLLQTSQLVGRRGELNLLTDWVAQPKSVVYHARILNIVAIGGMGKSALTWKWFNDIAEQEMKPLAGRLWWSFYESDARFENFVTRALAYVSKKSTKEIEAEFNAPEREERLLKILNEQPFLLVLDGLERILIAYARMDAARLRDDELDEEAANYVAGAYGLPDSAAQSFIGQHRLRKTADPRTGAFLRKLATVRQSRILVSTRLYPSELQIVTGGSVPGSGAIFLTGLQDDDALALWREMGVSGSRDALLPMFHRFENYPLLIRALAGVVAQYKRAPGDFDAWRRANPDFNPLQLPAVQVKSHVLQYALAGLGEQARKILDTIAAFRMPASYDTLASVLVDTPPPSPLPASQAHGEGESEADADDNFNFDDEGSGTRRTSSLQAVTPKLFPTERELDAMLVELEDRGLIGWDKAANRYDLHPIVRGVTWETLDATGKQGVYENLHAHFEAVPDRFSDWEDVNSLEDLAPAIELYNTLIGMGRYDDAYVVFRDRISDATHFRLSASRQRAELLEMLFPDGLDKLPRLPEESKQAFTLNALAQAYQFSGQPGRAAPLFRLNIQIREKEGNPSVGLCNLSNALRLSGGLQESEYAARRALFIGREQGDHFQEAIGLYYLGLALAVQSLRHTEDYSTEIALRRSIRVFQITNDYHGVATAYLAQSFLWRGDPATARPLADRAWELAYVSRAERDFIRAARLQGEAALGLNDFSTADERLHHALTRARAVNEVENELAALIALAEMAIRQGEPDKARERLDEVWEGAERGPFPLLHADGLNVLAQIEVQAARQKAQEGKGAESQKHHDAAVKAATGAYEKAWCDGISADGKTCYAYWRGLQKAKAHLEALGAAIPKLPAFDESKFEPLPEVEINPKDEFWVDPEKLE